jgi:pilus assembly protein Flp/PilA
MKRIAKFVRAFAADQSGATAIEYGLIVSLIFLAIIASIQAFTGSMLTMYAIITAAILGT